MAEIQRIQSKGIYHGLPVFSDDLKGLTAIVVGSNGISGHHMRRVLCESPERWTKIYAVSRRPPHGDWPGHVEHVAMDLLQSPEKISAQMNDRGLEADHVFFFAYIQPAPEEGHGIWDNVDQLVKVNSSLLSNFLGGLSLSNIIPKRVLLQLGAKYYGVHLGPTAVPQEESDPRVDIQPNFYYPQEDILRDFCQRHNIGWNVTRPCWILGAVPDAAMNLVHPLAIYAIVQRHLGQPLEHPGDLTAWETNHTMSSAQMNGYLAEWAVLTDSARNESFNAADGCPFTFGKFWPNLARRLDMTYTRPRSEGGSAQYHEVEFPYSPPPRGFGPQSKMRFTFTLTEWAKKPEVQRAWEEIAEKHQLRDGKLRDVERIFGFLDSALLMSWPVNFCTSKAKKLGFFGFVDSTESVFEVLQDFVNLKMIPPLPASDAGGLTTGSV